MPISHLHETLLIFLGSNSLQFMWDNSIILHEHVILCSTSLFHYLTIPNSIIIDNLSHISLYD